ncbi:MAG: hypothetical protein GZ091_12295 [Paludibacter sp.]|nr:hypothetical protein [Paludibacter sp.]
MVKIDDNTATDLDKLALEHYDNLTTKRKADGTYKKKESLIGRIQNQLIIDILFPERVKFWNYFLANNFSNLKRIITSRPDELQVIIAEIENLFVANFLSTNVSYNSANLNDFGNIVKNVINYEWYRKTDKPAIYFSQFNINFCPYCNKDEVQNIQVIDFSSGNVIRTRLYQLDHFYPRSRYPYLSLSFFNLIPGCAMCNATLKGEKDFKITTHFNPFHMRFNEHFKFQLNSIIPNNASEISIIFDNLTAHADNQIFDLHILERYNQGATKDILFDMINLFKHRTVKVQRSVLSQLRGLAGSVELSTIALLNSQGVPLEPEQINKKQLGKIKRDVCLQMEIIK